MADLVTLRDLLGAATGPSRELDWRVEHALTSNDSFALARPDFWPPFLVGSRAERAIPAYTASIDAALALADRLLPGWWVQIGVKVRRDAWAALGDSTSWLSEDGREVVGLGVVVDAATVPLALLLALVAVRIAQPERLR